MFVGHYASAFLARSVEKRLPLAGAFLAAQFVDLWWDAFILTGVERARLVPGLPSNPLDLYFMPYTHSLAGTLCWAALTFAVVKLTGLFGGSTRVALVTSATVASHWFLDLIVHRPDLPLLGDNSEKLGLGLWNYPALALVVEIGLLLVSAVIYVRRTGENATRIAWFVFSLCCIQIASVIGPLPPTIPAMAATLFVAYLALAWAARAVQYKAAPSRS